MWGNPVMLQIVKFLFSYHFNATVLSNKTDGEQWNYINLSDAHTLTSTSLIFSPVFPQAHTLHPNPVFIPHPTPTLPVLS